MREGCSISGSRGPDNPRTRLRGIANDISSASLYLRSNSFAFANEILKVSPTAIAGSFFVLAMQRACSCSLTHSATLSVMGISSNGFEL